MATNNTAMNNWYGRPGSFKPVAVQDQLPWTPRRSDGTVQVVLVHPLLATEFVEACHAAAKACPEWVPQRIDSYVPRPIRYYWGKRKDGTEVPPPKGWKLGDKGTSNHSWASAFDFFETPADVYPPGGVWTPANGVPAKFAAEFEKRGWTWGGRWNRTDVPHHEFSKAPGSAIARPGSLLARDYSDWLTDMLKQGDTGAGVVNLRLGLRLLNLGLDAPISPVFDAGVGNSVRQVQTVMGLVVDGLVGPATEGAISVAWADQMKTVEETIVRAYQTILFRDPGADGLAYWKSRVEAESMNPLDLARNLYESREYQQRFGVEPPPAATPPPAPETSPTPVEVVPPPPDPPDGSSEPQPADPVELAEIRIVLTQLTKTLDALVDRI